MQQHTVPQNITGFEFKLIGALTIKQFAYLAAASIFSFVFFLAIPGILKWFFIAPAALVGLAFAFLPVNGIGFDKWILLFIHAVFSPSLRLWHKAPKEISFLSDAFSYYLRRPIPVKTGVASDRGRLKTYLSQLQPRKMADKFDLAENTRLSTILFSAANELPPEAEQPMPAPEVSQLEQLQKSLEETPEKRLTPIELKEKVAEAGLMPKEEAK